MLRYNMAGRPFHYTLLCNRGLSTYPAGTPAAIAFKSAQCVGVCGIILFGIYEISTMIFSVIFCTALTQQQQRKAHQ
jgi:hypothetical protein